ncbi:hypothetical protein CKAH01_11649 [Colletotrichum kahawae]|uniref:Uncharacterized protein n=1 Tax=Colletotrichum kahawae TaxID=34407 RepID=A0AAD9YXG8_COLKA|nr:hypothetical protein CKAH01_11649 [Colletotrichum kahawae]
MSNRKPSFFLAPSWDFPSPPDCPIKLGNVIKFLDDPHSPMCTVPIAAAPPQKHFSLDSKKLKSNNVGFWMNFLSKAFGVGFNAGAKWSNSDDFFLACDSLITTQFNVDPDYIKRCLDEPTVKKWLKESNYRKPIYIITGIKTVKGTRVNSAQNATFDGELSAKLDGSASGVAPVTIGPSVGHKSDTSYAVAWTREEEFVFAYQVREVRVNKATDIVKSEKAYTKGANLDALSLEEEEEEEEKFELSDGEVVIEQKGYSAEEFADDTENLTWAIPKIEDESD